MVSQMYGWMDGLCKFEIVFVVSQLDVWMDGWIV